MLRKCCLRVVCATFHRRTGHGDARRFCHRVLRPKTKTKKVIMRRVYREHCSQGRAKARRARGGRCNRGDARSRPEDSRLRGPSSPGPLAAGGAPGTARGNPCGGGWGQPGAGSEVAPPGPGPGPARLTCDAGPGDALHHGFHGGGWGEWGGAALLPASRLGGRLGGLRPLRVTPGSAPVGPVRPGWRRPSYVGHAHLQVGLVSKGSRPPGDRPHPFLVQPQPQVGPAPTLGPRNRRPGATPYPDSVVPKPQFLHRMFLTSPI